jgi:hypothetical protein
LAGPTGTPGRLSEAGRLNFDIQTVTVTGIDSDDNDNDDDDDHHSHDDLSHCHRDNSDAALRGD